MFDFSKRLIAALSVLLFACALSAQEDRPVVLELPLEHAIGTLPETYAADREKLRRLLVNYRKREAAVFEGLARDLEAVRAGIRRDATLSPAAKVSAEAQVDSAKKWAMVGGPLENHERTLKAILDAGAKLSRFRKPLHKPAESLARRLQRDGRTRDAEQLRTSTRRLGGPLNARNAIRRGAVFNGERQQRRPTVNPIKTLRFTLLTPPDAPEGDKVEAGMEYSGHPHHVLAWETDGLVFRGVTGEQIREGHRLDQRVRYEGVLVGNAIFGTYAGKSLQGRAVSGTFRVELKSGP